MNRPLEEITEDILRLLREPNLEAIKLEEGLLKHFSNKERKRRNKRYWKRIVKFSRKNREPVKIVSEGDSWHQFPILIREIIDCLNSWRYHKKNYAIYSLGCAGDFLLTMINDGEYAKAIEYTRPSCFLLSGICNDFLRKGKLAYFLKENIEPERDDPCTNITDEFEQLLGYYEELYRVVLDDLIKKYPDMKIISHGYDYVIPSKKVKWRYPVRKFIAKFFMRNGQWLLEPLLLRGYKEKNQQREIIRCMVNRLNDMFLRLANDSDYQNKFIYVNLRDTVKDKRWLDEIHPNRFAFKDIAEEISRHI